MPASLAMPPNLSAPVKSALPQAASNPAPKANNSNAAPRPSSEGLDNNNVTPLKQKAAQEANAANGEESTTAASDASSKTFADLLKQLGQGQAPLASEDSSKTEEQGKDVASTSPDLSQLLAVAPPPPPPTPAAQPLSEARLDAALGIGKGKELELGDLTSGKAAKNAGETTDFAELLASEEQLLAAKASPTEHTPSAAQVQALHQPQAAHRAETSSATHLATPVRSPDWSNDFSQKVVWLANNDQQSAQITLNPPQLGPIEISLEISKDTTNAVFAASNPETRQAIEAALPQLREAFASAGLELGQANVSAENPRQQQEARPDGNAPRTASSDGILPGDSVSATAGPATPLRRGLGMVDTFA